jgi:hypothetical protein
MGAAAEGQDRPKQKASASRHRVSSAKRMFKTVKVCADGPETVKLASAIAYPTSFDSSVVWPARRTGATWFSPAEAERR